MNGSLIEYGAERYNEMIALRFCVLREPLGLSFSDEDLLSDRDDFLCGYYDGDILVGTCILSPISKHTVQLRQMAIDNAYRGKGVGRLLIQFAKSVAIDNQYTTIMLHARRSAVDFYIKAGYNIVGNEFVEVGMPHLEMTKQIKIHY